MRLAPVWAEPRLGVMKSCYCMAVPFIPIALRIVRRRSPTPPECLTEGLLTLMVSTGEGCPRPWRRSLRRLRSQNPFRTTETYGQALVGGRETRAQQMRRGAQRKARADRDIPEPFKTNFSASQPRPLHRLPRFSRSGDRLGRRLRLKADWPRIWSASDQRIGRDDE